MIREVNLTPIAIADRRLVLQHDFRPICERISKA